MRVSLLDLRLIGKWDALSGLQNSPIISNQLHAQEVYGHNGGWIHIWRCFLTSFYRNKGNLLPMNLL